MSGRTHVTEGTTKVICKTCMAISTKAERKHINCNLTISLWCTYAQYSNMNVYLPNMYSRTRTHSNVIWNSLWKLLRAPAWSVTHPAIWFLLFYILLLDQPQALDSILQATLIQGLKSGNFFLFNSYY